MMKTPHKHAELIKKWADDTTITIECRINPNDKWSSCSPSWHENIEYRIKPEVIRYRVALFENAESKWINFCTNESCGLTIEKSPYFVEWKTDWIEVEI